ALVIVNPANKVSELSLASLKQVLTGKITNWKEVGGVDMPIQIYSTESAVGGSLFVHDILLDDDEFDTTMRGFTNAKQTIAAVAADPKGIGFGPITEATGVKLVKISRGKTVLPIEPTMENVRSAKYPLSRYMYWRIGKSPRPLAREFCEWMVSKDG